MGGEHGFSISTLLGFLLTLVRVAGVFVFVPVPGLKNVVDPARLLLIVGVAIALFPVWPHPSDRVSAGVLAWRGWFPKRRWAWGSGWRLRSRSKPFCWARKSSVCRPDIRSRQPSTPRRKPIPAVLVVFAQTAAALLFFAMGLDREVLRIFAHSLETVPAGNIFVIARVGASAGCRGIDHVFNGPPAGAAGDRGV